MKNVVYIVLVLLLINGCNTENSYDGESGLISSTSAYDQWISNLYENVFQKDANRSLSAAEALIGSLRDLNQTQNLENLQNAQQKFKAFIVTQKQIEAVFLADSFNENYLDTLGYMEYFHSGKNSDMMGELDRIFDQNSSLESVLYKNSNKSITSLEYTLFGVDENSSSLLLKIDARRAEAALIMGENIYALEHSINNFYTDDSTFLNDPSITLSELINQLIDSAYKLKEWRIGEAAGLVDKYPGIKDETKLEYYKSSSSLEAIKAILLTHQNVMQNGLSDIVSSLGAASQAHEIEVTLSDAISLCDNFSGALKEALTDENVSKLYEKIATLQQEYGALISSMNFTQKILEADGD